MLSVLQMRVCARAKMLHPQLCSPAAALILA
jgi:hypothetical protein